MNITRNSLCLALIALAGTVASANPVAVDATTTSHAASMPATRAATAVGVQTTGNRDGAQWVYNVSDCPDCEDEFNTAWTEPGCFTGGACARDVYILPMSYIDFGDDLPFGAPTYDPDGTPGSGDEWITDIFFDDYQADADLWGDIEQLKAMVAFGGHAWTFNNYGSGVDKTFVFRYLWFSLDGATFYSGWNWELEALETENWHYTLGAGSIDEPLDPVDAFEIPYEGLICFDYDNVTLEGDDDGGAWNYFIGGDITDADFPYPTDLYELGFNDETYWLAAGIDDPNIDPNWDGDPDMGYNDILNTGFLIDWAFGGTGERGHGHPTQMGIPTDVNPCAGDLDNDGDTDQSDLGILLAAYQTNGDGDLDNDGDTDQSDLGILLADYGCQ